jgi:hypothetical protein
MVSFTKLKPGNPAYGLRRMAVTLSERYDGSVTIRDNQGKLLEYTTMKLVTKIPETNSKELNRLVDDLLVQQLTHVDERLNPWETSSQDLGDTNLYYSPKGAV